MLYFLFCNLREFHGTNSYICNHYDTFIPFKKVFSLNIFYYFSVMAVFHVKIETMSLKVGVK